MVAVGKLRKPRGIKGEIYCHPLTDFVEDMRTIITDVREACNPLIVLTTIYYMTGCLLYTSDAADE